MEKDTDRFYQLILNWRDSQIEEFGAWKGGELSILTEAYYETEQAIQYITMAIRIIIKINLCRIVWHICMVKYDSLWYQPIVISYIKNYNHQKSSLTSSYKKK